MPRPWWLDDGGWLEYNPNPRPMFGDSYGGGTGGESAPGTQDTAGLSPSMNSAAGVDLGPGDTRVFTPAFNPSVTTGGGPPAARAPAPARAIPPNVSRALQNITTRGVASGGSPKPRGEGIGATPLNPPKWYRPAWRPVPRRHR